MADLRTLAVNCAARDELVGAAVDEVLAAFCERGAHATQLNIIHHAVEHRAGDQLAADIAALLKQRTVGEARA